MNRLICVFSTVYALFALSALLLGNTFCKIALICLTAVLLLLMLFARGARRYTCVVLAIATAFGALAVLLSFLVYLPRLDKIRALDGSYIEAEGRIISASRSDTYSVFVAKCKDVNGVECKIAFITNETDDYADIGCDVMLAGELEFQYDGYNRGKECFLELSPDSYSFSKPSTSFWSMIYSIRTAVRKATANSDDSGLLNALIIGDRGGIPSEVKNDFKRLGTVHILSISGFHLSLLINHLYMMLKKTRLRRGAPEMLSISAAILYTIVAGAPLSLVRSAVMLSVFFLASPSRREKDNVTSLFTAGAFIVALSPWSLFDVGFLLSFFATLGIVTLGASASERYQDKFCTQGGIAIFRRLRGLFNNIVTTLSAFLATLPIVIAQFNEFSAFTVIGNIVTVKITELYLSFSFIRAFAAMSGIGAISTLATAIGEWISKMYLLVIGAIADISPELVSLDNAFIYLAVVILALATVTAVFFSARHRSLLALTVFTAIFIPLYNICSAAVIYPTAVTDITDNKNIHTAYVRWHGEYYLLDMSEEDKLSFNSSGNAFGSKTRVDTAVFLCPNSVNEKRIMSALTKYEIRRLLLFTTDREAIGRLRNTCETANVELTVLNESLYDVASGITVYFYPEIGSCFEIKNTGDSLSYYCAYTKHRCLSESLYSDNVVLCGEECYIESTTTEKRSFRLGT